MPKHGKRYRSLREKISREQLYALDDALTFVKENQGAKFDETVELHLRLGVDPRHADQVVRGTVSLPHGLGKTVRVAVFAVGEKEREAREAGADVVGGDDLVDRVQKESFLEFDVAIATPDMMAKVGKIGRILGPRGLMPNPKSGTVTMDLTNAVREFKAGKVEFRVDKTGIVHVPVGKRSFDVPKLRENILALVDTVVKAKPSAAKGKYLKTVTLTTTMGPGLRLDPVAVAAHTVAVA